MNLSEMIAQRDALDAQIKEITQKRDTAINSILTVMGNFGIDLEDLRQALDQREGKEATVPPRPAAKKASTKKAAAKKATTKRAATKKTTKASKSASASQAKPASATRTEQPERPASTPGAKAHVAAEPVFEVTDMPATVSATDPEPPSAVTATETAQTVEQGGNTSAATSTGKKPSKLSADTIKEYIYDNPPSV